MPTRVITGGIGVIPGASMFERRRYFLEHLDHVRKLLMYEPRGHASMSGAILQPPTRPDADFGVLFIEVSGCLPMCGHGTMGVATVLVETGMVEVTEPVTTIRLETPAGLVVVDVAVEDGAAMSVTLRNVPVVLRRDRPGRGRPRVRRRALRPRVRRQLLRARRARRPRPAVRPGAQGRPARRRASRSWARSTPRPPPVHPENPEIAGVHHVYLAAPGSDARHSRHAMAIHPGWFDRSPCGTGTSARMAQLHARGLLPLGQDFRNDSFIGTTFIGRLVEETQVGGVPAVVPTITGRAWVTGTAQYMLDPRDPFPEGFEL